MILKDRNRPTHNSMLLSSYIKKFNSLKVLVVGDLMLDTFVYGQVKRISPEAPVPVFNYERSVSMLGGAGNVAANLRSLGVQTSFIGVTGCDVNARQLSSLLGECGVKAHLIRLSRIPTIVKKRIISGNTHLLRIDTEEKWSIPEEVIPRLAKAVHQAVGNVDLVLLSDYDKGVLSKDSCQLFIKECKAQGRKVLVDPKGCDYTKYAGASLVKPNLKEFCEACGMEINAKDPELEPKLAEGAATIFEKTGIESLLITLSEKGMAFVEAMDPKKVFRIPTEAREVYDVSGAGDTSLATLGAALGVGADPKDAMKLANKAAGIVVGKLGTACVTQEELLNYLSSGQPRSIPKTKIVTLDNAREISMRLHAEGVRIGFTNGCFDLLHLGHITSLKQARELCDVLFVGMNSDQCVKRLKGASRPIQDEKLRATLLASLEFVDYVLVFDDPTAEPLVEAIRPDVIAKEGYAIENWPEGRLVQSYGGTAVTLKRVDGYSTTETVARIKDQEAR